MQQATNPLRLKVPPAWEPGDELRGPDGAFRVPEPDLYDLVLINTREDTETRPASFNGQIKENKYQVRLKIAVVGGEFDGVWFRQWVGLSLHEKAFLRKLIEAIRGEPLGEGEDVDILDYCHRPFRGVVKVDEVPARGNPDVTLRFAKVTDVMPSKSAAAKPVAAARPAYAAGPRQAATSDDVQAALTRAETELAAGKPGGQNPFEVDDY